MQPATLRISAIVVMRDEEGRIGPCLDSILANQFPHRDLEILVADGASRDASRSVVETYAHEFKVFHLLDNPRKTVSAGINLALQQARGQVVVIMGAHATYPPDYFTTCLEELDRTAADCVGGCLRTRPGANTPMGHAIAAMIRHPFGVGGSAFRSGNGGRFVDTVPYGAYRREVFDRVGPFSENLDRNQDLEFNARLRAAGGKLFLSQRITVDYYSPSGFKALMRQAFGNGQWLGRMWFSNPSSVRPRHVVPLGFLLVLLTCLSLSLVNVDFAFAMVALLSIYGLAAMGAAFQIAARRGWKLFVLLPGLFFAFHLVYGIGSLVGLLVPQGKEPPFGHHLESQTGH